MSRTCDWCHGPIPEASRRDAVTCSKRCRQARHRFNADVGLGVARGHGRRLKLAYADPPYPGLSRRYYGTHPDFDGEVDHAALVASLLPYDGWALSTSSSALQFVLSLCPPDVRVAAWVKGERPTVARGPLNSWEPVIFRGGRVALSSSDTSRLTAVRHDASLSGPNDASRAAAGDASRVDGNDASSPGRHDASLSGPDDTSGARRVDSLVGAARARTTDPGRVVGAKPAIFCRWIFDLLGAEPGDEFTDVFPGSGGVARAWQTFDRVS
ncbi:hypothetical protein EDF21_0846 [Frigoribacterium sp. PhB118]|nr:hypothetical protein EDF21_0846 [Frigoribacterium sp. PhB118]